MSRIAVAPGLYYSAPKPASEPAPVRTDVGGFLGRTRRGPVGTAVRVEGPRAFAAIFGGPLAGATTPSALQGYFDNEGQVAHVVRVSGGATATATWDLGPVAGPGDAWKLDFEGLAFSVEAATPGAWANGAVVRFTYRYDGINRSPEVDVTVRADGEPPEFFPRLDPGAIVETIAGASALIRLRVTTPLPAGSAAPGPRGAQWEVTLGDVTGGTDAAPTVDDYLAALAALEETTEPALIAAPDLHADLTPSAAIELLAGALAGAERLHDRLILVDAPPDQVLTDEVLDWSAALRAACDAGTLRAGALYHPQLSVIDPLGTVAAPLRALAPSGHVAGVFSRLDRERGAFFTPANAEARTAVDIAFEPPTDERALLNANGVNLLRCLPNRGIQIWGGRTLASIDDGGAGRFVAERRLIHLVVRTIRRVAEPLVFEANGPALWLSFVRAVTGVLLAAWRAGALKGATPAEAFRVRCDESTNPPDEIDAGRCHCEIEVAPAQPMEFILLRVALATDGTIDVIE
jgi:phage tail sheath protein FI